MIKHSTQKKFLSLATLISILVILIILFAIGCAFDFNISKALYSTNKETNTVIGGVISNIGISIGYFVMYTAAISLVMASYVYKDKQRWKTITTNIVGIIALIMFTVVKSAYFNEWQVVAGTMYGGMVINISAMFLIFGGAFCLSFVGIRKLNQEKVFKAMLWLLIFLTALMIVRVLLCVIWSRPRPNFVFADRESINFVPVWVVDPFRQFDHTALHPELRKSFPSGHTAMSGAIIGLMIVLWKLKAFKKVSIAKVMLILAIIIMLVTAFGRMLAGWHFLTDVSFGGLMAICAYLGMSVTITKRKIG